MNYSKEEANIKFASSFYIFIKNNYNKLIKDLIYSASSEKLNANCKT